MRRVGLTGVVATLAIIGLVGGLLWGLHAVAAAGRPPSAAPIPAERRPIIDAPAPLGPLPDVAASLLAADDADLTIAVPADRLSAGERAERDDAVLGVGGPRHFGVVGASLVRSGTELVWVVHLTGRTEYVDMPLTPDARGPATRPIEQLALVHRGDRYAYDTVIVRPTLSA